MLRVGHNLMPAAAYGAPVGINNPNDISNLVMWLDAGTTVTSGSNVTQWTNRKTGSSNHATQSDPDYSQCPQLVTDGGGPAVQFIQSSQTSLTIGTPLSLSGAARTVAVVGKRPASAAGSGGLCVIGTITAGEVKNNGGLEWYSSTINPSATNRFFTYFSAFPTGINAYVKTSDATYTDSSSYHAIICTFNGTNSASFYYDSAASAVSTDAATTYEVVTTAWNTIGVSDFTYSDGYMKQVVVYDKVLNSTEISQLMTWLLGKLA